MAAARPSKPHPRLAHDASPHDIARPPQPDDAQPLVNPGHGFADASPRRSSDSSPARDTLRPRPPTRLVAAHRCTQRRRRAQASRLFADSRPRPPPTATREKKVDSRQVQNMSRTHDCKSLNAANDLRFVAEVWQESRHTSGVSQGKTKTLPPPTPCCPAPVQKNKTTKKPTSRRTPTSENPTINHWTESSSSASISSTASATCERQCQLCPREKRKNVHTSSRFIWRPAHWPTSSATARIPPRCRSPAPPENGRGTRFSPAGSRPGQG